MSKILNKSQGQYYSTAQKKEVPRSSFVQWQDEYMTHYVESQLLTKLNHKPSNKKPIQSSGGNFIVVFFLLEVKPRLTSTAGLT